MLQKSLTRSVLIEDGITQGICQTDYPEEVAEMTFLYSNIVFDDLMQYSEEEKQRKIAAFIYNLERLLKMEQGSMRETILPLFQGNYTFAQDTENH